MFQALPKTITFEEFLNWKPDGGCYELHDGVIVEMQPVGDHEEINGFLAGEVTLEFKRLKLPYLIPKQALVKIPDKESGYSPDVIVINQKNLSLEPMWKKSSTVTQSASVPLVIEVVSTNWRDDYASKLVDYETFGVPEYWIVDYLALGGRRYIGNPKQPTTSVYYLVDGEYQVNLFRGSDRIVSPTFPELNLTAEQIFQAGRLENEL
ncbi:Uma2 family endonuclease [Komarekiella sp. 'clone 1']|uniref:Uma2 family endonuclease n=1 Tax=Komarekiella delphini-convector SJRDD-AB1 TaxID=2593771 RepID=A0AA40T156_9NOST|nr:Uma2 family endonuclease [Komarekiella delphini-convector]MBD6618785.1 Uma2 family endonuclease [Komarekiella delphini-convector SJRDD-AB1]